MADPDVEQRLTALLEGGALGDAATLTLTAYGDELFGFLVHHLHDDGAAAEVFSQLMEDLWRGLPTFQRRCSLRTWLYLLAKNAASRYRRAPWHGVPRTGDAHLHELAEAIRTRTPPWLNPAVKDRVRELRETLEPDDRSLLALRIDKGLGWDEVARIFLEHEEPAPEALKRESARLRKRLQILKDELRKQAHEAGLLEEFTN